MFAFRKNPVSYTFIGIIWILWAVNILKLPEKYAAVFSGHLLGDLLTPLGFASTSFGGALALTLMACFAAPAERLLGPVRYFVTGCVAQLASIPLTLMLARVIEHMGLWTWGDMLRQHPHISPIGFFVGGAGVASTFMPRLWRRRVRLSLLSLTLTLVFYGGSFSDLLGATTALSSIAVGMIVNKERPTLTSSVQEKRLLTALVISIVAISPLLVALNPHAVGPLSSVTRLMWTADASAYQEAAACFSDRNSALCHDIMAFNRIYGFGPAVADLIPLLLQLVLCFGLLRGRRLAWVLSTIGQVVIMVVLLLQVMYLHWDGVNLYGVSLTATVLPWVACLGMLWFNRSAFQIREHPRLLLSVVTRVSALLLVFVLLWVVVGYLVRDSFLDGATVMDLLYEAPLRFLPPVVAIVLPYILVPDSTLGWVLYEWTGTVFWLIAAWMLYRLFAQPANPKHDEALAKARAIFESGSGDHVSFMTLWDGHRYFFNTAGNTYVAYRASNGVALTLGEPVGEDPMGCAAEFEVFARAQALKPAWYSVRSSFIRPGFKYLEVAEEALLSTENTEFKGKKFQNVRTARNKAAKEGVQTQWTSWEQLDLTMRQRIAELSEEWVSEKALPEMGFTLGGLEEIQVPGTCLLLAVGDDGTVHGVTSWMPVYESGVLAGYTLDMMRRADHGFKGTIELLISEALLIAKQQGCGWISLSGAPLASTTHSAERARQATAGAAGDGATYHAKGAGGAEPAGASSALLSSILDRVGQELEPLYGFRTLAASKKKFQPQEQSWNLAYEDELALPSIGFAIIHAYLPSLRARDAARVVRMWLAARHA
ncbi:bifunctional lysylphosphatidylglycerol flippase/synthetase MprF [Corynebacterium sp. sy039]|uniref:bifunctional lysylphosphatidylglycerol flippase/synthetase MprF n=1 Tax=Corynebacterium sp. sy039 TaxID=2599641 RepID=UPI0011B4553A|nr:DUF2156 domain-containing protein [Corynebacterium sp. sy039]QDZ42005.1 DUF2156 domain-containing protein [Corynebacterium sp. sy039]